MHAWTRSNGHKIMNRKHRIVQRVVGLLALASLGLVSTAWAQVAVMPDRDALKGAQIVVWGNTTLAGGTAFTFDFGDGTPVVNGVSSSDHSPLIYSGPAGSESSAKKS